MEKRKARRIVGRKEKFFYPEVQKKLEQDIEKNLDTELAKQKKKLEQTVKKLKSKGCSATFLRNHVLTEMHINSEFANLL